MTWLGDSFDLKLSLPDPIDRLSDYCFNVMVAGLFKCTARRTA